MENGFSWQYDEIVAAVGHLFKQRYFTQPISDRQLWLLHNILPSFDCIGAVRRYLYDHFREARSASAITPLLQPPAARLETEVDMAGASRRRTRCSMCSMITGFLFMLIVMYAWLLTFLKPMHYY